MSLQLAAKKLAQKRAVQNVAGKFPKTREELDRILKYEPRPLQDEIEKQQRRFNSIVLHRRFGKTVMEIRKLVQSALFCPLPNGRFAYAAPTYSSAEDIAWTYLVDFHDRVWAHFGEEDGSRHRNKGRLSAEFPDQHGTRARVRLYGVDNPKERMRGLYLDGIVMDEWAMIPPSVWHTQVRPMLTDISRECEDQFGGRNQWADFIFTPKGRNHAYEMHRNAEIWRDGNTVRVVDAESGRERDVARDDWSAFLYKASETGYVSDEELDAARIDMGHNEFLQEYECSFDAAIRGAIFAAELERINARGQLGVFRYNNLVPVNTAWDLGFDDATAIWFFQHTGNGVNLVDYYEASGSGLDHYASVLAERGYRYGYHLLPHDVEQTELSSGRDRRSVLTNLGIRVTTVPKVQRKVDAISAALALLPRCSFNIERCSKGLDRMALYRREWDDRNQVFREKPVHDWASHGADAFMTLACGLRAYGYTGATHSSEPAHGEF